MQRNKGTGSICSSVILEGSVYLQSYAVHVHVGVKHAAYVEQYHAIINRCTFLQKKLIADSMSRITERGHSGRVKNPSLHLIYDSIIPT